jgi:predicted PurR-regulated permease PerM
MSSARSTASPPPKDPAPSRDLARILLFVLSIGLLIGGSLWVLQPFLGALIWATMVVVATWPIMLAVQRQLGGRRWLAVTLMTLAMLLVLVVPLVLAIVTIVDYRDEIASFPESVKNVKVPSPPEWVEDLPLVGSKVAKEWNDLAALGSDELVARAGPYVRRVVTWFAAQAGTFGLMLLHFLLTVVITAILYATGEMAARGVRRFGRRLAGDQGENSVILSAQAVRAVALGVVVTAIVQSTAAGIGLAVSGIPYAAVLTAIIFIFCIAQLGPILVLAPAVVWLYWSGDTVWGSVLLVWTILVGSMDNVLRPILIKRGADLPLLLIFAGVIGGLIAFGIIGLFVGPMVLAVTYRLLEAWVGEIDEPADAVAGRMEPVIPPAKPVQRKAATPK